MNFLENLESYININFELLTIVSFIIYTIFYYSIMENNANKPDIKTLLLLLIFHITHMYIIKKLQKHEGNLLSIAVLIVPIILYKLYSSYHNRRNAINQQEYLQYYEHMQDLQNQQAIIDAKQAANNSNQLNRSLETHPIANINQQSPQQMMPQNKEYSQPNTTTQMSTGYSVHGGNQECNFLEDQYRREDFSPNYSTIQNSGVLDNIQTNKSNIKAYDMNKYYDNDHGRL